MAKQIVVVGLGRFGETVTRTLTQLKHQVLALDRDERAIQNIAPFATDAVQIDVTDENALRELGVAKFDIGVVAVAGDITVSLMATVLLKRLGLPFVVARARTELHGATLEKVGADRVVFPEQETGVRLAHSLTTPNVKDYIEVSKEYGVSKIVPPESFVDRTLEELGFGPATRDGMHVLLIRRGNDILITPDRFERVQRNDLLIVSGLDSQLDRVRVS